MERLTHGTILFADAEKQAYYKRLKAYEDTGLAPEEIIDGRMLTGWIPVAERLPDVKIPADFDRQTYSDFGKCFLITDRRGFVYTATFHVIANKFDYDAVAWMPLPEPYKPPVMQETRERAGEYADAPTLRPAT